jgi:hypothetical protein
MSANTGVLGQPRRIGFAIVMFVITFGLYSFYWVFKTHSEVKTHSNQGVGGILGLGIYLVVAIVTWFLLPLEVASMYRKDGREAPVTMWTGLWPLLPIIGAFVWFIQIQNALNRYWESRAGLAAPLEQALATSHTPA